MPIARHTAEQHAQHQIAAVAFSLRLKDYTDIMTKIAKAKKAVIENGKWKTYEDCVDEIGEYVTDPKQDYLIEDFKAYVAACEAEYPKHGITIVEPGMIPERKENKAMQDAKIELFKIASEIISFDYTTLLHASVADQNQFLTVACKAVGVEITL